MVPRSLGLRGKPGRLCFLGFLVMSLLRTCEKSRKNDGTGYDRTD